MKISKTRHQKTKKKEEEERKKMEDEEAVIEFMKRDGINAYTMIPWSNKTVGAYANKLIAFHIMRKKDMYVVTHMKKHTNRRKKKNEQ
jgi:hypothetical protein